MRGMFTCGVIDVLMENGIAFDGAIGVSAGATFGCNYKSHQIGRALRYNLKYCHDKRYGTFYSVRKYGDIYEKDFCYRQIPLVLDPMDKQAYESNPMAFYAVATNCKTGLPVYRKLDIIDDECLDFMQAGGSMPLVSTPVKIGEEEYLDGGISDSIPLQAFMRLGYLYNVVILTQPRGYKKKKFNPLLLRFKAISKYKAIQEALAKRHIIYDQETAFVFEQEKAGNCFVIAPPEPLNISHTEHDEKELQRVYDIGKKIALENLEAIKAFLAEKTTK